MDESIEKAARAVLDSNLTLALTGAGISVESGIPDFRSKGGLWDRYDPDEYASIYSFQSNPEKVWQMLREMEETVDKARPNAAHIGLAELEAMGLLKSVITQNVDNLHQEGGSKDVIEYHGNSRSLTCLWCNRRYDYAQKKGEYPPYCECGRILKPDVVFFGEAIPMAAMTRSYELASSCQALLIIGTSAVVSPFNVLPRQAKQVGATIIEINLERTVLTDHITDILLLGKATEMVSGLVAAVRELKSL
ncbi:MAG: RNA polymerase subunit sigma [Deltaproteobacteria bacterium]|nr:NAD-dependent deacylase [Deltaproteobacteria bacterium]MBW2078003.1 NAD-dependent deacylase [Deltaproteobacteria bacterium]RLB31223.1 MAG: RNA polymerase subunit sigma [Deltaproteobacteria bacterium]